MDELSAKTHMTTMVLRRKLAFWQGKGLIKEVNGDKFILVEDGYREEKPNLSLAATSEDDDEADGYMASASDQHQEKLQVQEETEY